MKTSDSIAKLAPDLVKSVAAIKGAVKDAKNPHFRNVYASLESVIEASRDALAANGLCAIQALGEIIDGRLTCTTRLQHASGEYIESVFHMPLQKADPQGTGSTSTYARRYSLMAMLGLSAVDDDAEAGQGRQGASEGGSEPIHERSITPEPEGPDFWGCKDATPVTAHSAKKAGLDGVHEQMRSDILTLHTDSAKREWIEANLSDIRKMPKSWRIILRQDMEEQSIIRQEEMA